VVKDSPLSFESECDEGDDEDDEDENGGEEDDESPAGLLPAFKILHKELLAPARDLSQSESILHRPQSPDDTLFHDLNDMDDRDFERELSSLPLMIHPSSMALADDMGPKASSADTGDIGDLLHLDDSFFRSDSRPLKTHQTSTVIHTDLIQISSAEPVISSRPNSDLLPSHLKLTTLSRKNEVSDELTDDMIVKGYELVTHLQGIYKKLSSTQTSARFIRDAM
jgi:hypothetical protein